MFWINITTKDGEVLERFAIYRERSELELPIAEEARRVRDYLERRYDAPAS